LNFNFNYKSLKNNVIHGVLAGWIVLIIMFSYIVIYSPKVANAIFQMKYFPIIAWYLTKLEFKLAVVRKYLILNIL
jgi:hypothetical protein